jgi:hypothetical protein
VVENVTKWKTLVGADAGKPNAASNPMDRSSRARQMRSRVGLVDLIELGML